MGVVAENLDPSNASPIVIGKTNATSVTITPATTISGALTLGDVDTGTCSSNAVTVTGTVNVITTESLSTAAAGTQDIAITKVGVAADDAVFCQLQGGTNTKKVAIAKAVCTTDTITVTLRNDDAASLNGTVIFSVLHAV